MQNLFHKFAQKICIVQVIKENRPLLAVYNIREHEVSENSPIFILFRPYLNMDGNSSTCRVFLRIFAKCTILANFSISDFEFFHNPII